MSRWICPEKSTINVNVAWVISTYQGPSVENPALFNAEQRVHHPLHHVLVLVWADHLAGDISRLWPARHLYCLLPHTKTVLSKACVVTKIWCFNDSSLFFIICRYGPSFSIILRWSTFLLLKLSIILLSVCSSMRVSLYHLTVATGSAWTWQDIWNRDFHFTSSELFY